MNVKQPDMSLLGNLTHAQLTEVTAELILDALAVASATRISQPKKSDYLCSGPLLRDLLLSSVSRLTAARCQSLFWMEMNVYESGLALLEIGKRYTHGSTLAMEQLEAMSATLSLVSRLVNVYQLPEYIPLYCPE